MGRRTAFWGAPGQAVCLYLQPPPATRTSRFHFAGLGVPRRAHLDGSAGLLGRGQGSYRSAPRARRCPAPPAPLTPATRPGFCSNLLPQNLPLPPPPAHWPHAGRVTRGPGPIRGGLSALIPPHPPADSQPIRHEPRRGSPNPSRLSQWQRKTSAPGEGGGEAGGPASVRV